MLDLPTIALDLLAVALFVALPGWIAFLALVPFAISAQLLRRPA